jgi:hypothetical protein
VEVVLAKSLPAATDSAVIAVINRLFPVIVPQLADRAVIASSDCTAGLAPLVGWLRRLAQHTEHKLGFPPFQGMILDGVMAEPASIPSLASETLELHVPSVMLTAQVDSCFVVFVVQIKSLQRGHFAV